MRSERALKNIISNMILQIIIFLSGIVLPRFFLEEYGSSINGMVTSANQFLTYLSLAEAGVASASAVALYIPLANNDHLRVNSILTAAKQYYYRSGILFSALVLGLTWIYPYLISQQIPSSLARGMLLILAGTTVIDFFFVGKYRVLLIADQKSYVVAIIEMLGTAFQAVFTIALIYMHEHVLLVKSVGIAVYLFRYIAMYGYVRKKYAYIDFKGIPDFSAIKQKGAALIHQVVGIIVNNTDVVLLTILLGNASLLEVSVYGVYYMVVSAVNTLLNSFSNGLTAGFGDVISKKEESVLKESFMDFEYMYYIVLFTVCVGVGILLLPFITVYTLHATDAQYIRPVEAALFTCIVFLQNVRIPSLTIVCAAGHFKETQSQAVIEAVLNLGVSLLLIRPLGMAGVLIGTVCSYLYRTAAVIHYTGKNLVKETGKITCRRIGRNLLVSLALGVGGIKVVPQYMDSFVTWFLYACLTGGGSLIVIGIVNYYIEPQSFKKLVQRGRQLITLNNGQ